MANSNFVVQNGLTIGPLTIDAATGSITTTGAITSTSGITVVSQELITGTEVVAGNLTANSGTASSNTTTGALVVVGGVGVSGNVNVGTNLSVTGTSQFTGNITANHIMPSANVTYDLGSPTRQWHSVYVGPGTLYLNGKAVLQDNSGTITVSTTAGQNLQMATSGGGSLQLTTNAGGGTIQVQGPLQVAAGNNITSSDGNAIQFANQIGVDSIIAHSSNTNLTLAGAGSGKISIGSSITSTSGTFNITDATVSTTVGTGALVVAGGVGITGDLHISGNLYSYGLLAVNTQQLDVQSPLIYLTPTPSYPYSYDIGLYSHWIGGAANSYIHSGFVRSTSNNYWGLFSNVASEPTTTVNWSDSNLVWDKIKTGDHIIANTTASSSTTTGALQVAGGAGIAGAVYAGSVYDNGNRVLTSLSSSGAGNLTVSVSAPASTTVALPATGPGAVAVGSSTAIPVITTDAYGRVASTTTAAVVAPAGTLSGATLASGVTASSLTSVGTLGALTVTATITGSVSGSAATVTGAAQTAITSVGTLTGLTVSGAIVPNANATINLGSSGAQWATIYGVATKAQYADLAENYQADSNYAYGTVVMFGGDQEVTVATAETTAVAGVVSQNPAHLMNGGLTGANVVPLALQGRVPCNVIGPVKKGDMMVSAGFGYAKASANPSLGQVIGKALADFAGAKGQIEVVVGRQ